MNYELAKQLKDAGFEEPQKAFSKSEVWLKNIKDNRWYIGDKTPLLKLKNHGRGGEKFKWYHLEGDWDWDNYVYIPTLSELIEACGDRFYGLNKIDDKWAADVQEGELCANGKTPEEAVARLWLKLNE